MKSRQNFWYYHHHSVATLEFAKGATMRYSEAFYNRWSPHTNNEDLPPATATATFITEN